MNFNIKKCNTKRGRAREAEVYVELQNVNTI